MIPQGIEIKVLQFDTSEGSVRTNNKTGFRNFPFVSTRTIRKLIRTNTTVLMLLAICAAQAASAAVTLTNLHAFNGADGWAPSAGLVQGADGNFYGTTSIGGAGDEADAAGTLFSISPSGVLTTLHTFTVSDASGIEPECDLVQGLDGNFYGTTSDTVFKITPAGVLTTLRTLVRAEGRSIAAGLLLAADGDFYGTASSGGADDFGTVFKITPTGTLTVLHSFDGSDGDGPTAMLVQGLDGALYGTTRIGGSGDEGTVFRITTAGTLTTLHSFSGADGSFARSGLALGTDGNFYGTTGGGGANGSGSIFRITPAGALSTLYSFNSRPDGVGVGPRAALILGVDGNFYGSTANGPVVGGGIFRMTPQGTVTLLYAFKTVAEGVTPEGRLLQATDGNFYGTTLIGSAAGKGTIFKLSGTGGGAPGTTSGSGEGDGGGGGGGGGAWDISGLLALVMLLALRRTRGVSA